MCEYCSANSDNDLETHQESIENQNVGFAPRAQLSHSKEVGWSIVLSTATGVMEHSVTHCPWCGKELD